jgi:hypothetical protein
MDNFRGGVLFQEKGMKLLKTARWIILPVAAFVATAQAAEVPEIRSSFENVVYPEINTGNAADPAYSNLLTNQLQGICTGVNPVGGLYLDASGTNTYHQSNSCFIADSQLAAPVCGINADYSIGSALPPPEGADTNVPPDLVYLTGNENAVWIGYANLLLATDQGAVQVTWALEGGGSQTVVYTVSPNPANRPVRLYWTEPSEPEGEQFGPTVSFAQNYQVEIHYNSTVTSTNDVWIDSGQLHAARGVRGRCLLTYSRLDADTGLRELLGYEIVEVLEPSSSLQQVAVGDRLRPIKRRYEIEDLFAEISRGAYDESGSDEIFVYQHAQGVKDGWIWAIRETAYAWQIEIYWKAKEKLDVIWPFEVDIYDVKWGNDLQPYLRGDTETGDYEPRVYFPSSIGAEVMPYQSPDSGGNVEFAFVEGGALHTDDTGNFLLKYTAGDDVWFEPVHAQLAERLAGGGPNHRDIASEIRPANGAVYGDWPGYLYLPGGTDFYNPHYYNYPTVYVDTAAHQSAIYPVNRGSLEVWWANPSGHWTQEYDDSLVRLPEPVYFPSQSENYYAVWPEDAKEIVVASGQGNLGMTQNTNHMGALKLPGEMISIGSEEAISFEGDTAFTLETWVNPSSHVALPGLIGKGGNYTFGFSNGIPILLTGSDTYAAAQGVETGKWQHVAVSRAADGDLRFYLDGHRIGQDEATNALTAVTNDLYIGVSFEGMVDELRIWSTARTAEEIRGHMRLPVDPYDPTLELWYRFDELNASDSSPNRLDGTLLMGSTNNFVTGGGRVDADPGFSLAGSSPAVYVQNDPDAIGCNPNEEHALLIGETVYALRNDLNQTDWIGYSSHPYVLVEWTDGSGNPDMTAFKVVPSNELYRFHQFLDAGLMIQALPPLNLVQPEWSSANVQISGPTNFIDRNGRYWACQAGNDGGSTNYVFDYYYPDQPDFWYPAGDAPAEGDPIPLLGNLTTNGTPVDYTFTVDWPEGVPGLHVGATLTNPRDGLPAVRGQASVGVPYQQSLAVSNRPSVRLIDPTRARQAELETVPAGMKAYRDAHTGHTFFSELPPMLRSRMVWNPFAAATNRLQLSGEYMERTDGHNYLLLNVLAQSNRVTALDPEILSGIDTDWHHAVTSLPSSVFAVTNDAVPVDSLALSTEGLGAGYVTLVFNNSTNSAMVPSSLPVQMAIIKVEPELYRGRLDVIQSPNPLDKKLSLKYTADFAGEPERFEFEWMQADPDNGQAPEEDSTSWYAYSTGSGIHYTTIGNRGAWGLSDHYLRCRYRALDTNVISLVGSDWSPWTPPQLAEGWIKRVMKGVNPFEQRIRDYMNYALQTDLSMVQQAGAPYSGDVPLNYDALDDYGLIPLYQEVLNQSRDLSIDAGVDAVDSLALALLMVSGRLADFYTLLGNEAYADSLNPTVDLGAEDPVQLTDIASIFCFQNQLPDLLSEELALLRGRDDSMNPPVQDYPVFNRLPWNFTADIVGGEVAYALNYGISDLKGDQDGSIDVDDAKILYPQGHGDAWGHYLSALKNYYQFLQHPNFSWLPQVEGILAGDTEITISYLHEKKFAMAAAARAKAGADIVNKTYRDDANTNHTGIRIIDRLTTPELDEIADAGRVIQQQVDYADAGLNPLGLARNTVPFDISAAGIDAGETHFEQIYARALAALQNAAAVFERVKACGQALRDQNEAREFDQSMADEEAALERRLIEIYGYPYSDDIGPGKLYPEGYQGPDLLHYSYIEWFVSDNSLLASTTYELAVTNIYLTVSTNTEFVVNSDEDVVPVTIYSPDSLSNGTDIVTFTVDASGIPVKPAGYIGSRRAEGEIQIALSAYRLAYNQFITACDSYTAKDQEIELMFESIEAELDYLQNSDRYEDEFLELIRDAKKSVNRNEASLHIASVEYDFAEALAHALSEGFPKSAGFSIDFTAPARMGVITSYQVAGAIVQAIHTSFSAIRMANRKNAVAEAEYDLDQLLDQMGIGHSSHQRILGLKTQLANLQPTLTKLASAAQAVESARMGYMAAIAEGDRLQVERERLRMNRASDLNMKRYRNMAYHIFRNDELQRYTEAFDLAARYCYLAAKAYDYETGLLASDNEHTSGRDFMSDIVKARAIGRMTRGSGGMPNQPLPGSVAGDPGLADILARMKANWDVLDGRLGFNNPQTETGRFSLRQELFRIAPAGSSDQTWRDKLDQYRVDNLLDLPEFRRYCLPFTPAEAEEPALVIPFSTTIEFRKNFFGQDLAGGDNAYDSTHFATKIRSAGVWLSNFDNAFEGGLANQPRVYLIPVGVDRMRVPSDELDEIRSWQVADQALPVPYPIGEQDWDSPDWSVLKDSLGNELYNIRRYPSMRAYHDSGGFDDAEVVNNSRLIGRSVWNTKWVLIIPGGTLLADGDEGLDRFIHGTETAPGVRNENGVKDIRIFFQTYSYSGN